MFYFITWRINRWYSAHISTKHIGLCSNFINKFAYENKSNLVECGKRSSIFCFFFIIYIGCFSINLNDHCDDKASWFWALYSQKLIDLQLRQGAIIIDDGSGHTCINTIDKTYNLFFVVIENSILHHIICKFSQNHQYSNRSHRKSPYFLMAF